MKAKIRKLKIVLFMCIWIALLGELLLNKELKDFLHLYLTQHPIYAPFLLISLQLIFTVLVLPCSVLTVLAGMLWGLKLGIIYSTLATLMASSLTFTLGRYSFLNLKIKQSYETKEWLPKVNMLLARFSLWASAIAHINPLLPGSSLGYIFGTTGIKYWKFIVGAAIGTMPLQVMMVLIGDVSIKALFSTARLQSILIIFILAAVVGVYIFVVPKLLSRTE